jgi:hypothetical protein
MPNNDGNVSRVYTIARQPEHTQCSAPTQRSARRMQAATPSKIPITHCRFTRLPMVPGMGPASRLLSRNRNLQGKCQTTMCVSRVYTIARRHTQCSAPMQRSAGRRKAAILSRVIMPHHALKVHQVPNGAGNGTSQLVEAQAQGPARKCRATTGMCPVCTRLQGSIRSAGGPLQAATPSRIIVPHHTLKLHQAPDGAGDAGARRLTTFTKCSTGSSIVVVCGSQHDGCVHRHILFTGKLETRSCLNTHVTS